MRSYNREDYASADEWLEDLNQDTFWLKRFSELQNLTPGDFAKWRDESIEMIKSGPRVYFLWKTPPHDVKSVVEEAWKMDECSLSLLMTQTMGMLTIEWLEQHADVSKLDSKKAKKPIKKKIAKKNFIPKTLKYYQYGHKGNLKKQRSRVDIVFKKFNEWGWIDDHTFPYDFDAFFIGEPRFCNIKWTASSTILTILLQELLNQEYIVKQTGCAAKSLVKQQFGKTANSDRTRLKDDAIMKINAILYILDISNPLNLRGGDYNEVNADNIDYDLISIYADIQSSQLRSTKGI